MLRSGGGVDDGGGSKEEVLLPLVVVVVFVEEGRSRKLLMVFVLSCPEALISSPTFDLSGSGIGGRTCALWTSTGSHPPGACLIFASSRPRKRGMEGPVKSMSRIPTELPARERESASCVVTEDLPTPPLPERICSWT